MKHARWIFVFALGCLMLMPFNVAYAQKGSQVVVPDTVKDSHSKYTAKYSLGGGRNCTAILISSTAAITARHCGGSQRKSRLGTIYPGASGATTPFGYMNINEYIPSTKDDIAVIKGTQRDQSKAYQYYIRKFKTTVKGYSDMALLGFKGKDAYAYGYPNKNQDGMQYRSDGKITDYYSTFPIFYTELPAYEGQSGSGVFLKNGDFIGILTERTTSTNEAQVLPFTKQIADWVNKNAE